jgi:hypothetical protein
MYQYDGSYAVELQRFPTQSVRTGQAGQPRRAGGRRCHRRLEENAGHGWHPRNLHQQANRAPEDPGLERILRVAVKHDFPVNTAYATPSEPC